VLPGPEVLDDPHPDKRRRADPPVVRLLAELSQGIWIEADRNTLGEVLREANADRPKVLPVVGEIVGVPELGLFFARREAGGLALSALWIARPRSVPQCVTRPLLSLRWDVVLYVDAIPTVATDKHM
jgi:hypothetical protein